MFDINLFNGHISRVNSHLSRFKESSLSLLFQELSGFNGFPTPEKKKAIQNAIFFIPFDKQLKYKQALDYLATELGVKICGCPVKPTMQLQRTGTSEYSYPAIDNEGRNNLSTLVMGFTPVQSFHHVMEFRWKSSTGNMNSLKNVGTREHIKYRIPPNSSPFNDFMSDVPMEFVYGNSGDGAHTGFGRDDHSTKPPNLICRWPLESGEVVAEQWYQFTVDNQTTFENIPSAAYLITKGVRKSGNDWVFFFKKQNWEPHNMVKFKFEVEYLLFEPNPRPKQGIKLPKSGQIENRPLHEYAHKIISVR
ncbi:MAG: hypothetical protein JNL36_06740 [Candidatus Kapabacteria bacterium]|nr:hypothetical protein [Candidatus Kapabacteria bacterium]